MFPLKNSNSDEFLVGVDTTIRDALSLMSELGSKSLAVVDPGNRLLGTLSDGDVRRAILGGRALAETIDGVFFESPTYVEIGNFSAEDVRSLALKNQFDIVPVIDKAGVVHDVLTWETIFKEKPRPSRSDLGEEGVPVVIMAGGTGTRMKPFTNVLPKPLLPVKDKTIIEHIVDRFVDVGTNTVYLTVNYKSKVLKAFFEEAAPAYQIQFLNEERPLGTAGSLGLLAGSIKSTFFVTNCDVIVDADYGDIIRFHRQRSNALTLVASAKSFTIPYGACQLDESGDLSEIKEKPKYEMLVNAGLYVLEPSVLRFLNDQEFCHMTELIARLKESGERVGVYPISEKAWIDVGEWSEYRKALRALSIE